MAAAHPPHGPNYTLVELWVCAFFSLPMIGGLLCYFIGRGVHQLFWLIALWLGIKKKP